MPYTELSFGKKSKSKYWSFKNISEILFMDNYENGIYSNLFLKLSICLFSKSIYG